MSLFNAHLSTHSIYRLCQLPHRSLTLPDESGEGTGNSVLFPFTIINTLGVFMSSYLVTNRNAY